MFLHVYRYLELIHSRIELNDGPHERFDIVYVFDTVGNSVDNRSFKA